MAKNTMRNMTEGSVARHLFFFALPMMIGGLLQQFYNMVDSMVVGNFVSDEALAAVSSGWLIAFLYISLFTGLGTGATVVISQYYGAGQHERVADAVATLYTAMMVGIVPLTVIAVLLIHPIVFSSNYFCAAGIKIVVIIRMRKLARPATGHCRYTRKPNTQ